jgi:hypothetical protein
MSIGLYYSASPDWTPPTISYVGERVDRGLGVTSVKVAAEDMSGILKGLVTYTRGDGQWHSVELAYDEAADKWMGDLPAVSHALYFVQVVDKAGNVAIADNKGRYYELPGGSLYLPMIGKK